MWVACGVISGVLVVGCVWLACWALASLRVLSDWIFAEDAFDWEEWMKDFEEGPEIEGIAAELIPQYFPHLLELDLAYFFFNKEKKKNKRLVLGTCEKSSGLFAQAYAQERGWECDEFFTIQIFKETWPGFTAHQKRALVFHELKHAVVEITEKGDTVLSTVGHDFESFFEEIAVFGLWREDAAVMNRVMRQLELPLSDPFEKQDERDTARRAAEKLVAEVAAAGVTLTVN